MPQPLPIRVRPLLVARLPIPASPLRPQCAPTGGHRRTQSVTTRYIRYIQQAGTVVYDDARKECVWNIGRISKEGPSPSLNGSVTLLP